VNRQLRFADSGPMDASMIVPVIKRQEAPSDDAIVLPSEYGFLEDELVGELFILYAFDLPGHFRYVNEHDRQTLGLNPDGLRSLATRNLTQRRSKPEILRPNGPAMMFRLDGELEASLLLVDHLWPQFVRDIPGELVVAVPSRDVLAVSGTEIPGGVETLRYAARRAWERPTANPERLLTQSLLVRRDNSWTVFKSA
jgi:uncharacterized protein YtpQ (UPF0354 family)